MKLVNIKIVTVLVISYCIALVAMTPLSWLLPYIEPKLKPMGVHLAEPQGSIWSGQVEVLEKTIGRVNLQWDAKPASLFLLKLPLDVKLSNANLSLSGIVNLGIAGPSLTHWSGYIDDRAFAQLYRSLRADVNGRLQLEDVAGAMSWGKSLKEASGSATWSGGEITIPVGRTQQSYQVPMIVGDVSSDQDAWRFTAKGKAGQTFIDAELSRQGEGVVAVKSALAEAMDVPIPNMGENIFKMSQQVF